MILRKCPEEWRCAREQGVAKAEVWLGAMVAAECEAGMKREAGEGSISISFYIEIGNNSL